MFRFVFFCYGDTVWSGGTGSTRGAEHQQEPERPGRRHLREGFSPGPRPLPEFHADVSIAGTYLYCMSFHSEHNQPSSSNSFIVRRRAMPRLLHTTLFLAKPDTSARRHASHRSCEFGSSLDGSSSVGRDLKRKDSSYIRLTPVVTRVLL